MSGKHVNIFNEIDYSAAISHAAACHHRIVLVVGLSGSGKTNLIKKICGEMQIPLINLGLSLSQKLLPLTVRDRKLSCLEIISELIDVQGAPQLAIDNTEIVFEPSLMLNPQGLLQSLSRKHLLIWSWNGEVEDGHVAYAYPGHPEHQRIPTSEITLIKL